MKYNDNGEYKDIYVKSFDTLPVGTEVDYIGSTVPSGWEEVDDPSVYSTKETRCGTYMGKPLYRKIFTGTLGTTGENAVTTNISKNYIITKIEGGIYIENNKSQFRPINLFYPYQNVNYYVSAFILGDVSSVNYQQLRLWYHTAFSNYMYELCIYYTKD